MTKLEAKVKWHLLPDTIYIHTIGLHIFVKHKNHETNLRHGNNRIVEKNEPFACYAPNVDEALLHFT